MSGEDDPCMISLKRFERATKQIGDGGYSNVQTTTYPQMRHEILNEIDKQRVWKRILDFINGSPTCY